MELNEENLENVLKAVEAEAAARASVAGAKVAKPKGKSSPKKRPGLSSPWGSMNHRHLHFKDRGPVVLRKGVNTPNQLHTPRNYSVISRKRDRARSEAGLVLAGYGPSGGRRWKVATARDKEPRLEVFGSDASMSDFDAE